MNSKESVVFNPNEKEEGELPTIFCFSNVKGGGEGVCYAMAEDGTVLGSHYCSNEHYAIGDLGVIDGWMNERHSGYREHYPNGYRMEFVPSVEVKRHPKLLRAFELNQKTDDTKGE